MLNWPWVHSLPRILPPAAAREEWPGAEEELDTAVVWPFRLHPALLNPWRAELLLLSGRRYDVRMLVVCFSFFNNRFHYSACLHVLNWNMSTFWWFSPWLPMFLSCHQSHKNEIDTSFSSSDKHKIYCSVSIAVLEKLQVPCFRSLRSSCRCVNIDQLSVCCPSHKSGTRK